MLRLFTPALLVVWCAALGSAQVVQPGAPGQPARVIAPDDAVAHARRAPGKADVQFMQQMIGHHAQALEMTALAKTRTSNADLLALAARIETSQRDEIRMMLEWLRSHDLPAPDEHAHHAPGAVLMPGMLTPPEMSELAAATGVVFERRFLELMIKHHAGAITMVDALFARPDGGAAPDVFNFANDVNADQQMEINRMKAMLSRR